MIFKLNILELINFEKQNLMKQNKKLVWITGASSGIGKELCYKFSQENWDVALTARRKDKLVKITKEIGSNNTICPANVADKS